MQFATSFVFFFAHLYPAMWATRARAKEGPPWDLLWFDATYAWGGGLIFFILRIQTYHSPPLFVRVREKTTEVFEVINWETSVQFHTKPLVNNFAMQSWEIKHLLPQEKPLKQCDSVFKIGAIVNKLWLRKKDGCPSILMKLLNWHKEDGRN